MAENSKKGIGKGEKQNGSKENWLDMFQAVQILKTTRSTFYRWLREGKIRGTKVGRQWRFEIAEIERFMRGEEPRIELRTDITPLLDLLQKAALKIGANEVSLPKETEVQRVVGEMVRLGAGLQASDLHLQPHLGIKGERIGVLRSRVDGVLHPYAEFDIRLLAPIIEQWKVFSSCNPQEQKRAQDSRLTVDCGENGNLDMRLTFLPSVAGESLTVRFLSRNKNLLTLENLEFSENILRRLGKALQSPSGLIIVTGPAGSWRTTTLYACLTRINCPEIKIMTAEKPVEYIFPWVIQTQVDEGNGMTYAAVLRAIYGSDPDVILVGEIRDVETFMLTASAAMTGHLVMTAMHAPTASEALTRTLEMVGTDPFVVTESTILVLAQRLVRILCDCAEPADVTLQSAAKAEHLSRQGGVDWSLLPKNFRAPRGCSQCRETGYKGRTVIGEALQMSPEIARALHRGAGPEEIQVIAVGQGMVTMAADGIRKAALGITSLEEVLRVTGGKAMGG